MPRSSGQYTLPSGNPVVPGTTISSTWANTTLTDVASALTQSIATDGQTVPSANLPMGNFKHVGVGNATSRTDYAAAGQVQDSSFQWLTGVGGTNTITATIAPAIPAYVAGQTFRFLAAGANTGAVTININGLGAKAITKRGTTALIAGDIPANSVVQIVYDGTQFQNVSIGRSGQFIGTQVFTASGTYTPSAGVTLAIVEVQGGGGAGGGAAATGSPQYSIGGGGGSGAYAKGIISSPVAGAITVGGGGGSVSGGTGGAGAASSYQGLITAGGGAGGVTAAASVRVSALGGAGGTVSVAGSIINLPGQPGQSAWGNDQSPVFQGVSGAGGASPIGGAGGANTVNGGSTGANATGFGGGGGGAFNGESFAARGGGTGGNGIVIVHEYI